MPAAGDESILVQENVVGPARGIGRRAAGVQRLLHGSHHGYPLVCRSVIAASA
jgi:hypothetical protein